LQTHLLSFNQEKQILLFSGFKPEKFHSKVPPERPVAMPPFSSRGRRSAVAPQRKELITMATESQINANRENAKLSTGPKTEEGKAKSSRNNTFGLFAINNCVQPEEQEDYENFCTAIWTTLAPPTPSKK
jgi:hypothetical protein